MLKIMLLILDTYAIPYVRFVNRDKTTVVSLLHREKTGNEI